MVTTKPPIGDIVRSAAKYVRALLGVPDPHDVQTSPSMSAALILILLGSLWLLSVAVGGTSVVPPHWFYLPIGVAAARFGYVGAFVTALVAGIVAGPLLPADVGTGESQPLSDWSSRMAFFVAIGLFLTWLVNLYRAATVELRSSRAVAAALRGTVDPTTSDRPLTRDQIEAALRPGAFNIVLQPIVDLHDRAPVGFEALARFPLAPHRPPNEWFNDAWSVGLGVDLEIAAFRAALELLPDLPAESVLSVNISPATVTSDAFRKSLQSVASDRIVLEMTEHVPVSDYEVLLSALLDLREQGVGFAVDDAGAGYASLRHVIKLQPDIIKLDIGLVRGLDENPLLRSVTRALSTFGAEIGALVVAEGVEKESEAAALRDIGARFGQGYLFARPLPMAELITSHPLRAGRSRGRREPTVGTSLRHARRPISVPMAPSISSSRAATDEKS